MAEDSDSSASTPSKRSRSRTLSTSTPTKKHIARGTEFAKKNRPHHRNQKYQKDWEQRPEFKGWLVAIPQEQYKCKCRVCNIALTTEISTLKRHGASPNHKSKFGHVKSSTLDGFTFPTTREKVDPLDSATKKAEIRITAFLTEHNIPFNVLEHLTDVIKKCFPDSQIAQKIQLKRTKSTAISRNVLAKEEKSELLGKLQNTPFSISTDESTDFTTTKQACVMVRYFDQEEGRIRSKFLSLSDLFVDEQTCEQGATGENVFRNLMLSFTEINNKNIIGFGSDGCNVMMGNTNSVVSRMKERFPGITIEKCVCHSLDICASEACKELPRRCEELVRNVCNYFSHSAKRMAKLRNFQKVANVEFHRLLHPSQTRWLSLLEAVRRIYEQWPALRLYFEGLPQKERTVAVDVIIDALNNLLLKTFFEFLRWVLPKITELNVYFQHEKVVITELDSKMRATYKDLLLSYMSRNYILATPLGHVDPENDAKFLPLNALYLSIDVLNTLDSKEVKEHEDKNFCVEFCRTCLQFLKTLCVEMRKRYDFNNTLFPFISCLSPKNAVSNEFRMIHGSVYPLIQQVPRIAAFVDDVQKIDDDWRQLPLLDLPADILAITEPDVFWFKLQNLKNCGGENVLPSLPSFALHVLTLPHANTDCERTFSKVNRAKVKLRNRMTTETVEACVLTSQYVRSRGGCHKFEIDKNLTQKMNSNMYSFPSKKQADGKSASGDKESEEEEFEFVTFHAIDF